MLRTVVRKKARDEHSGEDHDERGSVGQCEHHGPSDRGSCPSRAVRRRHPGEARPADREATAHVEDNRPEKTRTGYGAYCKAWLRYCAESELPPAAVRTGTLATLVDWCWTQPGRGRGTLTAPTTIDRRLTGVVVTARRQYKLQLAEGIAEEARALLQAKVKQMAKDGETRGRGSADALLVRHMEKGAATLPDNPVRRARPQPDDAALRRRRARARTGPPTGARRHRGLRGSQLGGRRPRLQGDPASGRRSVRLPRLPLPRSGLATLARGAGPRHRPRSFAFRALHNRWHTVLPKGLEPETVGDILERIGGRADLDVRPHRAQPAPGPGHRVLPGGQPRRRHGEAGRMVARLQGHAPLP